MFKRKYCNNTTKTVDSEKIQLWWENTWLFFFFNRAKCVLTLWIRNFNSRWLSKRHKTYTYKIWSGILCWVNNPYIHFIWFLAFKFYKIVQWIYNFKEEKSNCFLMLMADIDLGVTWEKIFGGGNVLNLHRGLGYYMNLPKRTT